MSGLTPGSTVYIRCWPQSGAANQGTFQVCAYEPIPPPNDNPCGSISAPYALAVPTTCSNTTFTTESATAIAALYTVPAPSCGTPVAGGDVWFSAVMPATGSMTITSQAGSLTDMAMAVYTVSSGSITNCGSQGPVSLTQVGCNDNFGASTMPALTVSGTPGVTYYIRMWNKTSAFGTASICAVQNVPPPNDNPCGALALTVTTGCYYSQAYSNAFASTTGTTAPGAVSIPAPSCGTPTNNDVWFTAVVPASGQLSLNMDDLQMTDAAYAVYTATGSCGSNNLSLTQVPAGNGGCAINGSTNGALLPSGTVTGLTPGSTVYIRVWRQTGNDGSFLICARNPVNPAGCYYTLNMTDNGGDGWGASYVTLCIGGSCTNYTVFGNNGSIVFGAPLGTVITLTYNSGGAGFQNQISYTVQASNGFAMFTSSNPPSAPFGFVVNSDCNVPPAPISDCVGSFEVCNNQNINLAPSDFGNQDLNPANDGCLSGERSGGWFRFTTNSAGTIAFAIQVGPNTDYDFAIWGPYSGSPVCPPNSPPIRCNWSGTWANTGLAAGYANASEGAIGPPWSSPLPVLANQTYMLYVDNWSQNGLAFDLVWNNTPNTILDCLLPVEFLDFQATPGAHQVDLKWHTASERNTSHFVVERSFDGFTFEPIGQVAAMGNTSNVTRYDFVDRSPKLGVNYYRLDQVDNGGARSYSETRTAFFRASGGLSVYPNPAGETIWASLEAAAEGTVYWRVLDASGRVVRAGNTGVPEGVSQFEVPLDIEAGSYLLDLTDENGNQLGNARFVRR
ncbi:MAG: T9SS type A sorting domain-containing protein [Flavobacteriales bacterium]|nr:T9SS type A sorting domain-containing protein [Flavobacteriales bacterium]